MSVIKIREATAADCELILHFTRELAVYEKAGNEVIATAADIRRSLFGPDPAAHALICSADDQPAGFAVYFFNFSTWLGRRGLYLEDLYISPQHRGKGAGKALLNQLARIALLQNCGRFEWSVLDWNEPARRFYHHLGAKPLKEWIVYRLTGPALEKLANDQGPWE